MDLPKILEMTLYSTTKAGATVHTVDYLQCSSLIGTSMTSTTGITNITSILV